METNESSIIKWLILLSQITKCCRLNMYDLILTEFLDKHVLAFSPKREEISDEGSPEEGVWYQQQKA